MQVRERPVASHKKMSHTSSAHASLKYPRGSEWRRWDLHIHSPLSLVQAYGGSTDQAWEKFITELEGLPNDIKVIGINDYIFIEGYKKVLEFKKQGRLQNIELILPVIELRTNEFAGSGNELNKVNIHVVFPAEDELSPDVIQQQFINGLSSSYKLAEQVEWNQSPTIESLADLGQKVKALTPSNKTVHNLSDVRAGFNNLYFSREKIAELLARDCFHDKYLIAVGFAEWDQIQWTQAAALKRDIANFAHLIFTSGSDDEAVKKHQTKLKQDEFQQPLIHASDAHDHASVGKSRTWIKADPTFEGLKQTIHEPEDRVFIGEILPKSKNGTAIIDRVEIKNSSGWFEETPQLLNEGLVSIVGEKGAGKTALAELIALAAGDFDIKAEDPGSFVRKALRATKQITKTIEGCTVTVHWRDKSSDSIVITEGFGNYLASGKVRYLSQSFIEKKCHPSYADELQKEVENIIFQHIPIEERMGVTTFPDLKKIKTKGIEVKKNQFKKAVLDLNQEIHTLETEIGSFDGKNQEKEKLQEQIKQLEDQKPKPRTSDEEAVEEKITLLGERKTVLTDAIANCRKQLSTVDSVKTQIDALSSHVHGQLAALKTDFEAIGLGELHQSISLTIPSDFDAKLNQKRTELARNIQAFQGSQSPGNTAGDSKSSTTQTVDMTKLTKEAVAILSVSEVNRIIGLLEAKSSLAEEHRRIIRDFEDKISKHKKRITELEKAVTEIEQVKKPLLPQKIAEREKAYKDFVALLQAEKKILEEIYAPLKARLAREGVGEANELEFFARIEFGVDSFLGKARDIIDFRKGRYHRGEEALLKEIRNIADQIELVETSDVFSLIDGLYKTFESDDGKPLEIDQQLAKKKSKLDFYNWIFDVSDFKVAYGIKFQGTNIELLSPGKKGIVLLLMYLALDTESSVPLLIDQPEENLDNKSVYAHLIEYFRKAKQRRQIIMITHNPNLVLNTDAEQVIVANFEANPSVYPARLTYMSGAIENSFVHEAAKIPLRGQGIRQHGLDILEGGERAFVKRGQKWNVRS